MSSDLNPVVVGHSTLAAGSDGPMLSDRVAARDQHGMVSAEWAVGIIAAIAVAGVLLAVVTSGPVEKALLDVILKIIQTFSGGLNSL